MARGSITTELEKQNDAFHTIHTRRRRFRVSRYHRRIVLPARFGARFCVNSTVPLFVQNYNDQLPGLIGRLARAKARKQGKEEKYLR